MSYSNYINGQTYYQNYSANREQKCICGEPKNHRDYDLENQDKINELRKDWIIRFRYFSDDHQNYYTFTEIPYCFNPAQINPAGYFLMGLTSDNLSDNAKLVRKVSSKIEEKWILDDYKIDGAKYYASLIPPNK